MWFILHRYDQIGQIELQPDVTHDPIGGARTEDDLTTSDGVLPTFAIPLGPPVIDLQIQDLVTDKFQKASDALEHVINLEQINLVHRTLGIRYSQKLLDHKPNEVPQRLHYSFSPPEIITPTFDWLRPTIITLALHYKKANNDAALTKIHGMLELLPLSEEDKKILREHAGIELK